MKILIQQENLFDYRLDLLNRLGDSHELVVLTSNNELVTANFNFKIIKGYRIVIGKFIFNFGIFKLLFTKFDKYILLPNFYYVFSILFYFLIPKRKRIIWGCDTKNKNLGLRFRLLLARLSQSVIQYNDDEKEKLIKLKINFNKIFVANNTINVPNSTYCKNKQKTSLIYVGRLQARKKIDLLLEAFLKLDLSIRENIKIEIVGDGDIKEDLIKLSKNLNIDRSVIFHGKITDHEKLKEIFLRSYAYVSPDAIGLGLQHSFAYGVPVITSKYGFKGAEYFHLVDKKNCILWSENEKSLENAIEDILNTETNKKMSITCFNYYKDNLSITNMINKFNEAIQY